MMSNVAEYFSVRDMTVIFERIFIGIRFLGGWGGVEGREILAFSPGNKLRHGLETGSSTLIASSF